ncbi:MAG: TasA family protein [Solirubrobacteraceae bacterium]
MQSLASRPKRTLGALAVVLAAVGLTVGSGANFTASKANAGNLFATGTLDIGRDNGSAILTMSNMKPGDSTQGQITVQNTGSLTGDFHLDQSFAGAPDAGLKNALQLSIVHCDSLTGPCNPSLAGGTVYSGSMAGFDASGYGLPDNTTGDRWTASNKNRYEFRVTLPNDATGSDNALQGKSVSATYTWSAQS